MADVLEYGEALETQMRFWIVLLAFDFLTVILLIVGKATDWMNSLHSYIPLGWHTRYAGVSPSLRDSPARKLGDVTDNSVCRGRPEPATARY